MATVHSMFGWPRLILEKEPLDKCEELIENFLKECEYATQKRGLIITGAQEQLQKTALIKEVCHRRGYLYGNSPNFKVEGVWRVVKK
tara:strand:+ start:1514 stop:1774 length:261 start_codon:yes stop_codon:yes gene_type:complete